MAFRLLTGVPSWIRRAIKSSFGAVLTEDSESVPSSAALETGPLPAEGTSTGWTCWRARLREAIGNASRLGQLGLRIVEVVARFLRWRLYHLVVPDKPKTKRPKPPAKRRELEKLVRGALEPDAPESPLDFVHRRMRELEKEGDNRK